MIFLNMKYFLFWMTDDAFFSSALRISIVSDLLYFESFFNFYLKPVIVSTCDNNINTRNLLVNPF